MKGREVILTNRAFTLDELADFMREKWDTEEYSEFEVGRPNPFAIEEYIMLPATSRFLVLVYPRAEGGLFNKKNKVVLVVSQTDRGNTEMLATAIGTKNIIFGAWKVGNTMSSEKERKGPAEDVLQAYTAYMKELLEEAGYLD